MAFGKLLQAPPIGPIQQINRRVGECPTSKLHGYAVNPGQAYVTFTLCTRLGDLRLIPFRLGFLPSALAMARLTLRSPACKTGRFRRQRWLRPSPD